MASTLRAVSEPHAEYWVRSCRLAAFNLERANSAADATVGAGGRASILPGTVGASLARIALVGGSNVAFEGMRTLLHFVMGKYTSYP